MEHVYTNLCRQVAEIQGQSWDGTACFDTLVALLREAPPADLEVVVWLDGIDEASDRVECFLPRTLGDRVCMIVSARADDHVTPAYLVPWLTDEMAVSHNPTRHFLTKLPSTDVEALVEGVFAKENLGVPSGLAQQIFAASDNGYVLFARSMAETVAEDVKEGRSANVDGSQLSITEYVENELRRLESLSQWAELQPLFALLTIAKEAISVDDLPLMIGMPISPRALPRQLMRWLRIVEAPRREHPTLLSFAHPLLSKLFGQGLGYQARRASSELCHSITNLPFDQWPAYAFRHLPYHLFQIGWLDKLSSLLKDEFFIAARFKILGAKVAIHCMKIDWIRVKNNDFDSLVWENNSQFDDIFSHSDHYKIWMSYSDELGDANSQGFCLVWRQLMHDVGLMSRPLHAGLITPQPRSLAGTLRPPDYQNELFDHAIKIDDRAGFAAWTRVASWNSFIQRWGPVGEPGPIMHGHKHFVRGVTSLRNSNNLLSWSNDGTLRFWNAAGEAESILTGHVGAIYGVLLLDEDAGFVSWGSDGTLRFWSNDGDAGLILRGHTDRISGALILRSDKMLLSWSDDNTLRLWELAGRAGPVMRGHLDQINGAMKIEELNAILSWGNDCTLRLWGMGGEVCLVMRDEYPVAGVVALDKGQGFLSWNRNGHMRFWALNGETRTVVQGHRDLSGLLPLRDNAGFITWSIDGTARLWGAEGEEGPILYGHRDRVNGALQTRDNEHIVTWSRDGTLRLWSNDGFPRNMWLSPAGEISHVEPYSDEDEYLVIFGGRVGVVSLRAPDMGNELAFCAKGYEIGSPVDFPEGEDY